MNDETMPRYDVIGWVLDRLQELQDPSDLHDRSLMALGVDCPHGSITVGELGILSQGGFVMNTGIRSGGSPIVALSARGLHALELTDTSTVIAFLQRGDNQKVDAFLEEYEGPADPLGEEVDADADDGFPAGLHGVEE